MLAVRKRPGSVLFELIVMSWHILKRDRRIEKGGRKRQIGREEELGTRGRRRKGEKDRVTKRMKQRKDT